MGSTLSKAFQISLSDKKSEKVRCYSACCGSQVSAENRTKNSAEDFDIID